MIEAPVREKTLEEQAQEAIDLLEYEPIMEWLNAIPEDQVIGRTYEALDCPLYHYLQWRGYDFGVGCQELTEVVVRDGRRRPGKSIGKIGGFAQDLIYVVDTASEVLRPPVVRRIANNIKAHRDSRPAPYYSRPAP